MRLKKPVKMHGYKKWQGRFKPSKAMRSWNGAAELLRRGIETAAPVAFFEKKGPHRVMQNYYICEQVNADCTARKLLSAFAAGETQYQGIPEEEAYRQLSTFVFTMHRRGVFYRDLSGGNILITKSGEQSLSFSLIDTGRAHFFDHPVSLSKRISDLTRICTKMSPAGRDCFMQIYLAKLGQSFGLRLRIPFLLYNAKALIKRKLRKKNLRKIFVKKRPPEASVEMRVEFEVV
jgi:serine/threonine protein kinase